MIREVGPPYLVSVDPAPRRWWQIWRQRWLVTDNGDPQRMAIFDNLVDAKREADRLGEAYADRVLQRYLRENTGKPG